MRELRVRCGDCGELEVSARDLVVRGNGPGRMRYTFDCPECGSAVVTDCTSLVGRMLLFGGARVEPGLLAGLSAFSPSDVAKLQALLDEPDWFDQLRRAG